MIPPFGGSFSFFFSAQSKIQPSLQEVFLDSSGVLQGFLPVPLPHKISLLERGFVCFAQADRLSFAFLLSQIPNAALVSTISPMNRLRTINPPISIAQYLIYFVSKSSIDNVF